MLEIPAFLYGLSKDVKNNTKKIIREIKRGKTWETAIPFDRLNVSEHPGLIALNGPSPLLGRDNHFHVYVFLDEVIEAKLGDHVEDICFNNSLQSPWRTLSLLSPKNQIWLYDTKRHKPFLKACQRYWDLYAKQGDHYTMGLNNGTNLWAIPSNLKYVLAKCGVPVQKLQTALPGGQLKSLLSVYLDK